MPISIDKLVNDDRFSGDSVILFILYIPCGLLLLITRSIILSVLWIVSSVLPRNSSVQQFLSTITCFIFGVFVKTNGSRDSKTRLLISNYVSVLDCLALSYSTGSISPKKWILPPFLAYAFGVHNIQTNKQHSEDLESTIFIQPEEIATNGKGILKFKEWAFQQCNRVQPVSLSISRPFTNVTVHSGSDSAVKFPWSDTFWFLWTPCTNFILTFQQPAERKENESDVEFAKSVQIALANSLEIEATEYTSSDLLEFVKRHEMDARSAAVERRREFELNSTSNPRNSEFHRMAQQVKEVMPVVPMQVIMKDLARTRSVDVTLTNLLDGTITYVPEAEPENQPGPSGTSEYKPSPIPTVQTAPTVFPKNAKDRQLSFEERKAQLIASARQKYIEKHGLSLALNNC